jgi:outer membrane protein OmpA-like peptidoglycan-associated protein
VDRDGVGQRQERGDDAEVRHARFTLLERELEPVDRLLSLTRIRVQPCDVDTFDVLAASTSGKQIGGLEPRGFDGDHLVFHIFRLSFAVGSAQITPDNHSLLTTLQRVLREFPLSAIVIEGHTDAQGHDEFNQALSQRRADAVREYLLANMGLSGDRVTAAGFGEARPLATNETPEGRAKNRRIDVRVQLPDIGG